jgi:hypothetical protein
MERITSFSRFFTAFPRRMLHRDRRLILTHERHDPDRLASVLNLLRLHGPRPVGLRSGNEPVRMLRELADQHVFDFRNFGRKNCHLHSVEYESASPAGLPGYEPAHVVRPYPMLSLEGEELPNSRRWASMKLLRCNAPELCTESA